MLTGSDSKMLKIIIVFIRVKVSILYRVVFIFGSLLIWAYTVLQDARSPLMLNAILLTSDIFFTKMRITSA